MKQSDRDTNVDDLPWPSPCAPRAEISAKIRHECTRDIGQCRRVSTRRRVAWCAGMFTFMFGALILLGNAISKPDGFYSAALLGVTGWGAVLAFAVLLGLSLPPGRRSSRTVRLALAVGAPVLFVSLLSFAAQSSVPVSDFVAAREHGGWALGCGFNALLLGAVASFGVLHVFKHTDPLTPRLSGALAGVFGGLTSAVAVGCACPSTEGLHLFAAHGLIVFALALGGAALGRRWLTP